MLELLIKKNEYNQVVILGSTLLNNYQSIAELVKQLEISKSSLFRYLAVINEEFKKIHPVTPSISSDGVFLHLNNPGGIPKNNLFVRSLKTYLQNSTQFKLLLALSNSHNLTTNNLLVKLHISHSYFNKLLKEINNYIKPTQVFISQRNNRTYLDGPEVNLVVFKLLLKNILFSLEETTNLNNDSKNHSSPFNTKVLKRLTSTQQKSLYNIEEIISERKQAGHSITIDEEEIKTSLTILKKQHNLVTTAHHDYSPDLVLFLNLITRFAFPKIDEKLDRIAIAKAFLKEPTTLTQDTQILLTALDKAYDINLVPGSPLYYDYFYQGMMSFLYLRVLNYNFNTLFTLQTNKIDGFYIYNQSDYIKIKEIVNLPIPFINKQNEHVFRENSELFTSLIFTAIRRRKHTQLNVYLDFQSELSFETYLKSRINTTFHPGCIYYCQTLAEADLVVTNSLVETAPDQPAFIFLDINSSFSMGQLLVRLMELYTKKLITPRYEAIVQINSLY